MSNNKICGECQYLYTPDWTTCLLDGSHIVRDKPACERFKQKIRDTNGDKIRAMRDEELADTIDALAFKFSSRQDFVDWLNKEVKDV